MRWKDRVAEVVDRQPWLDQVGDTLHDAARPVLERPDAQPAVSFLRGDWLGHPLHPALTDIPLGCWTASVLLDVVCESRAAGVLTAAGSAAAVGAAASGFVDWTATEGRTRRYGVAHALLNSGALALQLCSLGSRLRGRKLRAFSFSVFGLSVAAASAWLGGELAFGQPAEMAQPE
jgi:uncharacterized membrane protein